MLSRDLWRALTEVDSQNPIFRRVSQMNKPSNQPRRGFRPPLWLQLAALIALLAAVIASPSLLTLVFAFPILLITLMVAAPLLLPGITLLAGLHLTAEVIGGICREKRQHTYDLICALTQGRLGASWSFAVGMAHRGGWFAPLRWGTLTTLRAAGGLYVALGALMLLLALTGRQSIGIEQARLLLLIALLLALYYSNMTQIIVQSLLIGLLASSFELSKPDATVFGLFLYILLTALPLLAAGLILFAFGRLVVEPAPLLRLAAESAALLLLMALRELLITLLWRALERRLDWGRAREPRHLEPSLA